MFQFLPARLLIIAPFVAPKGTTSYTDRHPKGDPACLVVSVSLGQCTKVHCPQPTTMPYTSLVPSGAPVLYKINFFYCIYWFFLKKERMKQGVSPPFLSSFLILFVFIGLDIYEFSNID
ncbi:MAG: hypothetical protein [Circoviridae sp.]|nr:MAG: hypothetical protein [Circoviridae sp.]